MKEATVVSGGLGVLVLNFGGIPSTILFGWFSDLIGGRRGMVCVLCFIPILVAFTAMIFTPAGFLWLDMALLAAIGLFIYPVINLIVIIALDLTGKKAIGTAAGLIGLFGYLGRTVQAKGFGWMLDYFGELWGPEQAWALIIVTIIACTLAATVLMAFTWKLKPKA
jgi:OPA family glycerol-3-phosphate transporter-like MFS transporter